VVENGRQALDQLQANQYNLLILDYQMPEVDGAELLRILHQEHQTIPTIVLSGDAPRIVLPTSIAENTPVLTKPISPLILLDKILLLDYQMPSPTIDLHYLRQITHNQPELMVDLMDTFIKEAPIAVEKIDQAWKINDPILLNRAVHKAKPSFQYIGASEAEPLLNRLEADTERSERVEDGESLIQQLRELTQTAIQQLSQERNHVLSSEANKAGFE
jgi:CheY-like chemotaxis protein